MTKWNEVLDSESKYLKAGDIGDHTVKVKVSAVDIETLQDQNTGKDVNKPILHFVGKEKGVVMNITNCRTMEKFWGEEMDDWVGAELELFVVDTEKGPGLRVRKVADSGGADVGF